MTAKRLLLVTALTWVFWALLITVEVIWQQSQSAWLRWTFFASMLPAFAGCVWAYAPAFPSVKSEAGRDTAIAVASLVTFGVMVYAGIVLGVNFKFMIGGHL